MKSILWTYKIIQDLGLRLSYEAYDIAGCDLQLGVMALSKLAELPVQLSHCPGKFDKPGSWHLDESNTVLLALTPLCEFLLLTHKFD